MSGGSEPRPLVAGAPAGELTRDELLEHLTRTRDAVRRYQSRFSVTVRLQEGGERVLYRALPRQDQLHGATAPNILFGGAAGGTKSHGLRWHGLLACLRVRGVRALLLRRTFPELNNTHILKLQTEVPPELATYNQSAHRLTFPTTGSILQLGHCQHEKDIAQYLSTEWDLILVDEASEFTPRMLALLMSRLRTTNPHVRRPQFVCASNPGGEAHLWLLQHFIHKNVARAEEPTYDPREWLFIPALVTDNAYINDDYLNRLLALPEAERRAYLYGDWTVFAGQFFREWHDQTHCITLTDLVTQLPEWWRVKAGMDWGYDPHPAVLLVAAFDPYGRATFYRELTWTRTTPRQVGLDIARICTRPEERAMLVYGDTQMWTPQANSGISIAQDINDALAEAGSAITLIQGVKERLNGWMRVHSFLDPRRPRPEGGTGPWLRVVRLADDGAHPYGCPMLIQTLPAQTHDEQKPGDMKKQANDHWSDAARYLLMSEDELTPVPMELTPAPSTLERVGGYTRRLMQQALAQHNEGMAALERADEEGALLAERLAPDDDAGDLAGLWD